MVHFLQLCLFRWIRRVGQVSKRGCPSRTVWLHSQNSTAIHLQTGFNGKGLVNLCVTTVGCATTRGSAAGPQRHSPISSAAGWSWWWHLTAATPLSLELHRGCFTCPRSHFSPCWLICLFLKQLQFITHQSAQFCSQLWLIILKNTNTEDLQENGLCCLG